MSDSSSLRNSGSGRESGVPGLTAHGSQDQPSSRTLFSCPNMRCSFSELPRHERGRRAVFRQLITLIAVHSVRAASALSVLTARQGAFRSRYRLPDCAKLMADRSALRNLHAARYADVSSSV